MNPAVTKDHNLSRYVTKRNLRFVVSFGVLFGVPDQTVPGVRANQRLSLPDAYNSQQTPTPTNTHGAPDDWLPHRGGYVCRTSNFS